MIVGVNQRPCCKRHRRGPQKRKRGNKKPDMQGREALARAAVRRIDPERLLAVLDGLTEAAEASERGGAVAPTSGVVRPHDQRAVVEPERLLEAALLVLFVAGPLDLLRVRLGGRRGVRAGDWEAVGMVFLKKRLGMFLMDDRQFAAPLITDTLPFSGYSVLLIVWHQAKEKC